jgi:hypothetical protein
MRAGLKFLALIAVVLPLTACGNKEADQAKAFADLLQTRILDQPGAHIPVLNDEERAKIGPYAEDLAILKTFNDDLAATTQQLGKAMHPAPADVAPLDLPKYRADLLAARDFFAHVPAGLDDALAKAEASRAKLHQPEAVKAKFDAAFARLVTQPANALREITPVAVPALNSEIAVADFVEAHKANLKAVGGKVTLSKPALRKQWEALLLAYAADAAKVEQARGKLQLAVEGR